MPIRTVLKFKSTTGNITFLERSLINYRAVIYEMKPSYHMLPLIWRPTQSVHSFPFPKVDSLPFNDPEDLSASCGSPHLLSGDADQGSFQTNLMRCCNFTVFMHWFSAGHTMLLTWLYLGYNYFCHAEEKVQEEICNWPNFTDKKQATGTTSVFTFPHSAQCRTTGLGRSRRLVGEVRKKICLPESWSAGWWA